MRAAPGAAACVCEVNLLSSVRSEIDIVGQILSWPFP